MESYIIKLNSFTTAKWILLTAENNITIIVEQIKHKDELSSQYDTQDGLRFRREKVNTQFPTVI